MAAGSSSGLACDSTEATGDEIRRLGEGDTSNERLL